MLLSGFNTDVSCALHAFTWLCPAVSRLFRLFSRSLGAFEDQLQLMNGRWTSRAARVEGKMQRTETQGSFTALRRGQALRAMRKLLKAIKKRYEELLKGPEKL